MSLDKVNNKLDEKMRKVYQGSTPRIYGQVYWYVLGFTKKGKKVMWGPMMEEEQAWAALGELIDGEKFGLSTRDPHRAVREVRDMLIKRGTDPDEALRRMLHKRGEEPSKSSGTGIVSKLFKGRLAPRAKESLMLPTLPPQQITRISREE